MAPKRVSCWRGRDSASITKNDVGLKRVAVIEESTFEMSLIVRDKNIPQRYACLKLVGKKC